MFFVTEISQKLKQCVPYQQTGATRKIYLALKQIYFLKVVIFAIVLS